MIKAFAAAKCVPKDATGEMCGFHSTNSIHFKNCYTTEIYAQMEAFLWLGARHLRGCIIGQPISNWCIITKVSHCSQNFHTDAWVSESTSIIQILKVCNASKVCQIWKMSIEMDLCMCVCTWTTWDGIAVYD